MDAAKLLSLITKTFKTTETIAAEMGESHDDTHRALTRLRKDGAPIERRRITNTGVHIWVHSSYYYSEEGI